MVREGRIRSLWLEKFRACDDGRLSRRDIFVPASGLLLATGIGKVFPSCAAFAEDIVLRGCGSSKAVGSSASYTVNRVDSGAGSLKPNRDHVHFKSTNNLLMPKPEKEGISYDQCTSESPVAAKYSRGVLQSSAKQRCSENPQSISPRSSIVKAVAEQVTFSTESSEQAEDAKNQTSLQSAQDFLKSLIYPGLDTFLSLSTEEQELVCNSLQDVLKALQGLSEAESSSAAKSLRSTLKKRIEIFKELYPGVLEDLFIYLSELSRGEGLQEGEQLHQAVVKVTLMLHKVVTVLKAPPKAECGGSS